MTKPEDVKSAYSYEKYIAGVAAEVAKKYIEKAIEDTRGMTAFSLGLSSAVFVYPKDYDKMVQWMLQGSREKKDQWLKENGVI